MDQDLGLRRSNLRSDVSDRPNVTSRKQPPGKTGDTPTSNVTQEEPPTDTEGKKTECEEKQCKKNSTNLQSGSAKPKPSRSLLWGLVIILGAVASAAVAYKLGLQSLDKSILFNDLFRQMKYDFPEQYDFTWQILNISLNKFIKGGTNSPQPTIILMLGTGDDRDTVNCLSDRVKTIVQNVSDGGDCPGIKSKELVKSNDTILKLELERNVNHTLTEMKCHALVIEDIDLLREAGLNLLQAYCDHENAPYKTVTIILTATTKKKPPRSLPKDKYKALLEFQKMAREHLDDAWKTVSSDYREAWLSRFMQYVVVTGEVSQPIACANKNRIA